jgi:hypothetical protein
MNALLEIATTVPEIRGLALLGGAFIAFGIVLRWFAGAVGRQFPETPASQAPRVEDAVSK